MEVTDRATERRVLAETVAPHLRAVYASIAEYANEADRQAERLLGFIPHLAETYRIKAARADYLLGLSARPPGPLASDIERTQDRPSTGL